MSFTHALKWSFASELAAKAIQPVVFIVLARMLTPEDFGVMTAAMMVIAFSQIFWEAGMGKALIQRQTDVEEAANAAFFINIALGIVIAGLLYLFAQPIAQTFFQDDRVTAVLQVMTLQVLLGALSSVQTALLQKEMDFKKLFWVRFATVSLPGLASIPLAWNGFGYWALVAGTLFGQTMQVIMLWRISSWHPKLHTRISVAKQVSHFGFFVMASGLLGWYYNWMDIFFVGRYLGIEIAGEYRIGSQLAVIIFSIIYSPIIPVIYSKLSSSGCKKYKYLTDYPLPIISTWVAAPIGILIFGLSESIAKNILGPGWSHTSLIISMMIIVQSVGHLSALNGEVYRAEGRPSLESLIWLLGVLFYTPVYYYTANTSLDAFLYGRVVLVIIFYFFHLAIISRILKYNPEKILFNQLLIITSLALMGFASIYFNDAIVPSGWLNMVTTTLTFLSLMFVFFMVVENNRLVNLCKEILQKYRNVSKGNHNANS